MQPILARNKTRSNPQANTRHRPSGLQLGKGRGGVRFNIANAPDNMQEVFGSERVYCGGFSAQQYFHVRELHHGIALL